MSKDILPFKHKFIGGKMKQESICVNIEKRKINFSGNRRIHLKNPGISCQNTSGISTNQ